MRIRLATTIVFCFILLQLHARQEDSSSIQQLPSNYLDKVSSKANQLEQKLYQKADKALQQMMKLEAKMKKKLAKIDSLKAKEIFANIEQKYKSLEQRLQNGLLSKNYIPSLDTLITSVKFLQQNPQLLSQAKEVQQKLKDALGKVNGLENQFQKAEEIKNFLNERKQFLKEQLSKFGFTKGLKKISKQAYYYQQQLEEYKALLKDHKKAERKVIELLSKTKLFKDFMRRNSFLARLFPISGEDLFPTGGVMASQAGFAGLQTRAQINSFIQQSIGGSTNAMSQMQRNIQDAQSQIDQLRAKILKAGGNGNDLEMPDFKPNSQKTKSFFKRLEYGTSFQSQKANGFFPTTSDIGLSVGYKLNNRSVLGIGASYKLGLGKGWNNIKFTNEGAGIRSFIDWNIKGGLWMSGGYEQNYRTLFNSIDQLKDLNAWQQSGLLGLTKSVSLKSKFLKKTKLQLLWDFLSYQQKPKTQPVLFRVGYNF